MIVVDSSVWIDFFNGRRTTATDHLESSMRTEFVAIGDLILVEVLQGFRSDSEYRSAKSHLANVDVIDMLGTRNAIASAENFRALRKRGITIRRTTDAIIATACIARDVPLLFADRDFEPFVAHLGLRTALPTALHSR